MRKNIFDIYNEQNKEVKENLQPDIVITSDAESEVVEKNGDGTDEEKDPEKEGESEV